VIPIGDENVGHVRKPYVNWTLIAINAIVFFYELSLPPRQLEALFFQFGAIPAEIARFQNLSSILTSMFLHGGWWHFLGNMLFLLVFGDNIEDAMGHVSYLLFYLLCGIAAALTQVVLNLDSLVPMIGASGAISGVLGAYIALFPHGNVRALLILGFFIQVIYVPAWVMLGLWFVLQLVSGVASLGAAGDAGGVAFWAHVGGFVAGVLLVWLFRDREHVARQRAFRAQHHAWERVPARSGAGRR
jgi:membrane associated rhomboid family serine protease